MQANQVLESVLVSKSTVKSMVRNVWCLLLFLSCAPIAMAQGLTATLQKGENMTAFYGIDAFKAAIAAADSADVITLSGGIFNTGLSSTPMLIPKPVTIIGCGAIDCSPKTSLNYLKIAANKVKIEGVYMNEVTLGDNVSNITFFRSEINSITSVAKHTKTLVDQCKVSSDGAITKGVNYCIKNSVINNMSSTNTTLELAYVENCVIFNFSGSTSYGPYAIYKNNIILSKFTPPILRNPSEIYNNLFYCNTFNLAVGSMNKFNLSYSDIFGSSTVLFSYSMSSFKVTNETYKGTDGTPVGVYGGNGFSSIPTNPQITAKTIDSHTDKEGKINVKITVKAQP